MKPTPHLRFIQVDCREGRRLDLRQAKAVLRYRPDVILFEYPNDRRTPNTIFNRFPPGRKPLGKIDRLLRRLQRAARHDPWVASDIRVWENILHLWREGRQVLLYAIDGPSDLAVKTLAGRRDRPARAFTGWLWWVRIYLRERFMAENIRWVLNQVPPKRRYVILVFLQCFHWDHVKFLLNRPVKNKIWHYYFSSFTDISRGSMAGKIKLADATFYRYWKKFPL